LTPAPARMSASGLRDVLDRNAALLLNAGALATGTLVTAALGFAYWFVAARSFSPEAVGVAAAAVSMMNLLAQAGETGLGPMLIGHVPRRPRDAGPLIASALWAAAAGCAVVGLAYGGLAQVLPLRIGTLLDTPAGCLLFAAGVGVTGLSLVVDQAFVGLMRSSAAMWRGIGFATGKLVLLAGAAWLASAAGGTDILVTWIVAQGASLLVLAAWIGLRGKGPGRTRWHSPSLPMLRPLVRDILGHHAVNVALQAPALALPLVVTVALSAETNAAFYAGWAVLNVALLVPASLATVVYSSGSADASRIGPGLRLSLAISAGTGLVAGLAFLLFSPLILRLFSPLYPAIAGSSLALLGFGALAVGVKYHYVAVQRLHGRLGLAAIALSAGGALELAGAILGARHGGLQGLAQGWLAAAFLQAVLMAPTLLRAAFPSRVEPAPVHAAPAGLAAAILVGILAVPLLPSPGAAQTPPGFVGREGTAFHLDGKPFRVAGVNNHYLAFGSQAEVTRVLDEAVAMGANVVRTFIQPVIGAPDGSVPTIWNWKSTADASDLGTRGAHVMSWDPKAGRMAFNDGPDGLARMDFVLAEAARRRLKLIVAFVDFWGYTGGAQQMSAWYGSRDKYTFFAADPRTRKDYKDFVTHVLTRTNAITGKAYRDDPTVMAWELANEPDIHPLPNLVAWVGEMSRHVKSVDPAHLVATGHANMAVPFADLESDAVDFGTWHGYASYAKMSHADFDALIRRNCRVGEERGKPILLEEFGVPRTNPDQAEAYRTWLATIAASPGCPGWVVWRLVSRQDGGRYPEDAHDGFDVRNDGGATWAVLRDAARDLTRSAGMAPPTLAATP
jgi:mannan endo-1,4-beta-mannosidase